MDQIPVLSRTQRRFESRQRLLMLVLVASLTIASFFLGVMVGERGGTPEVARQADVADNTTAQVASPPLTSGQYVAPQKMTFYEDLPKGNAAPLGSGINLPKASPSPAPPSVPPAPAAVSVPSPASVPQATPAAAPVVAPPKSSGGGGFIVQVASTKNQAEAKRLADKLTAKGFVASSERADLGAKGIWYRVVTGPYTDQATAEKAAAQLKKQKFAAMVRKF